MSQAVDITTSDLANLAYITWTSKYAVHCYCSLGIGTGGHSGPGPRELLNWGTVEHRVPNVY